MLRPPRREELEDISALCFRSKAYWGYDAAFMSACRDELTLTAPELADTIVSDVSGVLAGMAQVAVEAEVCEIVRLFVAPEAMGEGHGAALFEWCRAEGLRRGATSTTIESDPGAQGFYERMGATLSGSAPSGSIPRRRLPLLEVPLRT